MIDVYLPLPLAPVNKNQDPHVLFRLGTIPDLIESGQKFRLGDTVLQNLLLHVMIIGYYQDKVLVKPVESGKITEKALDLFFRDNDPEDYRKISIEEYWLLYPEE
ncbi:hypothetical protein FJR06_07090 [Dolichospermum sp. UHCC 0352]|jgi:hypothetical protein|uniref:hypothetical protein n=1 Tax=Nostocales TaxID=1161 RepID=UPI00029B6084|nr:MULTISPECIES: hypothetical protein [Nostocales]AFW94609.1 hypothetical protein ANA_C11852 [Anabaena sp. 90]MTJ21107.1 hypothetical protein [Dolichospermum sp. UHCC 0352]